MTALELRRLLCLLTAFLIVLLCFFQYFYPGHVDRGYSNVIQSKPRSKHLLEDQELIQVLRRAAMPDRNVVLTMVDESEASPGSMLELLLQSFKYGEGTQRFLNHLVIITMDPQAFQYCRSLHPHCIHPSTFEVYFAPKRQSITYQNEFSWRRNNVLIKVLDLGYNILFTDVDVLWLRSPLSNISPDKELAISCSEGQREGYLQDGGIFFLKADAIAFEFFKYWKFNKILYPNYGPEESLCTTIMQMKDVTEAIGFRVTPVNTTCFAGFCRLNQYMLRDASTVHANCCDDLTSKVHDLRIILDDWIRFRKHASGGNASDQMALKWPQKCMR